MKKYTSMFRKEDVQRDWHIADVEGAILGRAAATVAKLLIGKHKPSYTPHVDGGDFVVVTNVEKIAVTGNKLVDKMYYRHSQYPGGLKERRLEEVLVKKPEDAFMFAVKRMLPKNKLGSQMLTRLRLFVGTDHKHEAQQPKKIEL